MDWWAAGTAHHFTGGDMRTLTRLALSAGLIGLAACAPLPPAGALFVSVGPPVYYQEDVVGVAPGPDYVFIRGYWDWGGGAYVWVPGRWVERPYANAVWVEPRWRHANAGWYREEGHWRGDRGDHDRGEGHGDHGDRDR